MEIRDPTFANDFEPAPGMILRPLTTADAGEAAEVIRTAFAAQNRPTNPPSSALRETADAIAAKIATGGGFGAFEGGALIAAALWSVDGDALHVARISVAPKARGRGVVRSLITACETEARRRGVRRMTLKTRLELPENERLFGRFGFARREVEAHPGFEAPTTAVMEKLLR
ncbi:MAG TPA: GNAT family N-acetyltransferase [Roseiarcus sp.]|jgi:predicted N-acetyltransferase YhbS